MRRRQPVSRVLPADLAVFTPELWPGRDDAERYGAWMVSRSEWADAHDLEELPGDEEARVNFPDGEFRPEDV